MKLLMAVFALISFGIFVPNSYADDLSLNLGTTALGTVDLGPVAAGTGAVTYDKLNVPLLNPDLGIVNLNFTAAFVDAGAALPSGAILPAGSVDALVITESCVAVMIVGGDPCPGFSLTYLNANVGDIIGVTGALNIGADVNADVAGIVDPGLYIGTNTETIGFGAPPAATPEPGTLSLMGTGLLGLAGIVRRKFRTA